MLPDPQSTKPVRPVMAGGERYVSLQDAIAMFGVSRRTLYNWMNAGVVEFAYAPGGSRYVLLASLALKTEDGRRLELDVEPSRYIFLDVR